MTLKTSIYICYVEDIPYISNKCCKNLDLSRNCSSTINSSYVNICKPNHIVIQFEHHIEEYLFKNTRLEKKFFPTIYFSFFFLPATNKKFFYFSHDVFYESTIFYVGKNRFHHGRHVLFFHINTVRIAVCATQ